MVRLMVLDHAYGGSNPSSPAKKIVVASWRSEGEILHQINCFSHED